MENILSMSRNYMGILRAAQAKSRGMDSRTTLRLVGWGWQSEHPLSGLGQRCGELIVNSMPLGYCD